MRNFLSEDDIEIAVMQTMGNQDSPWRKLKCFTANAEDLNDKSNRSDKSEVVFKDILLDRLRCLNKGIPEEGIQQALSMLTSGKRAMSLINANIEIYNYI